jgi:hypothetical protein
MSTENVPAFIPLNAIRHGSFCPVMDSVLTDAYTVTTLILIHNTMPLFELV